MIIAFLINTFSSNSFDTNPTTRHTVFSVVIGGFFYWASLLCVNQSTVQKAMSLRNLTKAKIALTLSIVGLVVVFLMNFYTGLMTYTKYSSCDPLSAGKIDAIDQLVPFYVMETFSQFTAFVGIFVAGIFAASLGTVAACLSSLSAVTIEDLLVSGINIKINPSSATKYAKWMNFGYGVISFGLIFLVEGRSILQATLTLNGLIGGIILGLFSLGIFFKKANLKGALYGGFLATLCVLTLGILALSYGTEEPFLKTSVEGCSCSVNNATSNLLDELVVESPWYTSIYKVSYMWYSMIGTLLTIFFGLSISIMTQSYDEWRITQITTGQTKEENFGKFTSNAPQDRSISAIVHESTTKIEHKLWDVISHPHLHHDAADRIQIMNQDETVQVGEQPPQNATTSVMKMFEVDLGIDNKAMTLSSEDIRK